MTSSVSAPPLPDVAVEHCPPILADRRRGWRRPGVAIGAGIALLAGAAAFSAAAVDHDSGHDFAGVTTSVGRAFVHLRWQFTAIVITLAVLHYLATAIGARAAAGIALQLRETFLVQLAAAAANRLTPAGIGGASITARFLTRRGLDVQTAIGAVAALAVLGAAADLIVLSLLVFTGRALGLGGGAHELSLLVAKLAALGGPLRSRWLPIVCAIVVCALVVRWLIIRGRPRSSRDWRRCAYPLIRLTQQPRAMATLLTASASTTLVLAFAFAATTAMVPGPHPQATLGALLVAYMAASAAGTAVPVPAGLGSTEAALIGVLVTTHVPASHAVEVVLVYRIITFWLPAVVGVASARHLRRTGAI